jgi:DNA-binding transcriptional MerR regulator/quercetin dioxygenase-like cupin family protein
VRTIEGRVYLTIGELAARAQVSPSTLRVWEAKGLLKPARSEGRQRLYSEADAERVVQIAELRRKEGWNPAAIATSLGPGGRDNRAVPEWSGVALRTARKERGLRLREAAERIGVSPSFLSAVERDETGVSTAVIARIADAYLMPISAFTAVRAKDPSVIRKAERTTSVLDGGVTWEDLVLRGHELEPSLLTAPPGEGSGGEYSRPGESFVFLLAGRLRFALGDDGRTIELGTGDALLVPARTTFSWTNPGRHPARAVWVEQLPRGLWNRAPLT